MHLLYKTPVVAWVATTLPPHPESVYGYQLFNAHENAVTKYIVLVTADIKEESIWL